jgi:ADP-L-glycero-D-manno-heptose 6-epimerase
MGALYAAVDQKLQVDWVDTPEEIRDRYQYFTQADIGRLLAAGYDRPFRSVEEGVADYVEQHLAQDDPYR